VHAPFDFHFIIAHRMLLKKSSVSLIILLYFEGWNKDMKKKETLITAVFFGLLPVLFCTIYCGVYHKTLADIFLPASLWNDELFYYKQVDGILSHGLPGGYFGFNESHGRYLSFAAWSPVLLYIWVAWGLIFGWNLMSPIICNLVFISLCMFAFGYLARPNRRQAATIAVLLGLFSPFTRYMMSVSLEVLCCSLLFLYLGALFAYEREKKDRYLWMMLIVAGVLTLTRPYFVLLMLYPAYFYGKQNVKKRVLAVLAPLLFFVGYAVLNYCFSAPYLTDLFEISFLTTFWEQGIGAGFTNLWVSGKESVLELIDYLKRGLQYGFFAGCMYGAYGLLGVLILLAAGLASPKRVEEESLRTEGARTERNRLLYLAGIMAIMMVAILYMYNINTGNRHVLTFLLVGIVMLGMVQFRWSVALQGALAVVLCFFFLVRTESVYDYLPPFGDEAVREEIATASKALEEKMEVQPGIGWDNTVIWLAYDVVDGEAVAEQWQQLYALPGGFGINYCSQPYVYDHLENIQSRYIAAIPGGDVEAQLQMEGAELLHANEKIAIYDRRPNETD